jgi:hypothetical protein
MDVSGSAIIAYLGFIILTLFLGGVGIFYLKIVLENLLREELKKQAESNQTVASEEPVTTPPPPVTPTVSLVRETPLPPPPAPATVTEPPLPPPPSPSIVVEKPHPTPRKPRAKWQKFGLTALLGVLIFTILLPLSFRSLSQKQIDSIPIVEPFTVPTLPDLSETSDLMNQILENYNQLAADLQQKNWQAADQLTYELTLKLAGKKAFSRGYIDYTELESLPCDQFQQIDQLWRDASEGKFGFSAQQIVYKTQGQNWQKYYAKVGWANFKGNRFTPLVDRTLNWDTRRLEYSLDKQPNYENPPIGHLPVTISWVRGKKFPQFAEFCEF